jgi:hypothetical protein
VDKIGLGVKNLFKNSFFSKILGVNLVPPGVPWHPYKLLVVV